MELSTTKFRHWRDWVRMGTIQGTSDVISLILGVAWWAYMNLPELVYVNLPYVETIHGVEHLKYMNYPMMMPHRLFDCLFEKYNESFMEMVNGADGLKAFWDQVPWVGQVWGWFTCLNFSTAYSFWIWGFSCSNHEFP